MDAVEKLRAAAWQKFWDQWRNRHCPLENAFDAGFDAAMLAAAKAIQESQAGPTDEELTQAGW